MADVKFSTFVAGLSADTIGGAEKIPVIDTTPFHITPDLLSTYILANLTAAAAVTPTAGDAVLMERSGTEGTFTLTALSAWIVDELEAITTGTTIVSGDTILYVDGGVLKQIDIDAIDTFLQASTGTLGAQINGLGSATLADSDEYVVSQSGTGKKTTFTAVAARVHAQFGAYTSALTAVVTPADANELFIVQGGTSKKMTLTVFANTYLAAELNLEDFVWPTSATTPSLAGDKLLMERSGTITEVDIDTLVTYFGSGLQASVLDFSGLGSATPNAADEFVVDDGGTPKSLTLTNLETKLWTDFQTDVLARASVSTVADTDVFWCSQGGTIKQVTPVELSAYMGSNPGDVIAPVTTTEDYVPQWDSAADTLKNGLSVQTTVRFDGSEADTALATEKAVSEAIENITNLDIDGGTDIGAALVDADLIIVDDGAGGTNRKSAMSRVQTYVHPGLATTAGTGITAAAASYVAGVEKVGTLFRTLIVIDIAGLRSTAAGDIIGDDGTANPCHIGQITAARNGTIFAGKIECLETPAGGDPDIDLYSATEATGVEDDAISGLTETQLIDAGDHAANAFKSLTAFPAANEYLYLVAGDTTDADYTTGILVIELWGK